MTVDASVERKLAAVLVADVEGYSRQMHEDEEAAPEDNSAPDIKQAS